MVRLISITLTTATLVCATTGCATLTDGAVVNDTFVRTRPLVVAHRGFSHIAPENTLAAYKMAIDAGAQLAECDVHLSADGVPVLIHDDTVNRTTQGTGKVSDHPLAELKKLDAGRWKSPRYTGERIPTLAETLALIKGKLRLIIEIKSPRIASQVVQTVHESGIAPDQLMVFSFHDQAIREIARLEPRFPTVFLIHRLPADPVQRAELLAKGLSARAQGVGVWRQRVDARFVRMAHDRGFQVFVYTVNVEEDMEALIEMGVDVIITDRPDVALGLLK